MLSYNSENKKIDIVFGQEAMSLFQKSTVFRKQINDKLALKITII